jgi:hypothetical protein
MYVRVKTQYINKQSGNCHQTFEQPLSWLLPIDGMNPYDTYVRLENYRTAMQGMLRLHGNVYNMAKEGKPFMLEHKATRILRA